MRGFAPPAYDREPRLTTVIYLYAENRQSYFLLLSKRRRVAPGRGTARISKLGPLDRLVKLVAEAIRRDDKEHPELPAFALVRAPFADVDATGLELTSNGTDARDKNGRTVLGRIAAVDRESDARTVTLHDYGWHGI